MHAGHIKPWSKGGWTVEENCQMLCRLITRKRAAIGNLTTKQRLYHSRLRPTVFCV
ncbi:MAG: HNH endonuclease [Eubacterium sp.]|nr:HNH endonuclease [Eubacterium sp.]